MDIFARYIIGHYVLYIFLSYNVHLTNSLLFQGAPYLKQLKKPSVPKNSYIVENGVPENKRPPEEDTASNSSNETENRQHLGCTVLESFPFQRSHYFQLGTPLHNPSTDKYSSKSIDWDNKLESIHNKTYSNDQPDTRELNPKPEYPTYGEKKLPASWILDSSPDRRPISSLELDS